MSQYRQGDIFIETVESMPDGLEEVPRDPSRGVVLALGESTNHAHAISDSGATLFRGKSANDDRFLRVLRPVSLLHEEHAVESKASLSAASKAAKARVEGKA